MTDWLEGREGGVRLRVRVQPRASRSEIVGEHAGALKIRLAAPPVEGEANRALVKLLAKRLGVATSNVRIVAGETAKTKVIDVEGIDARAVRDALGAR